MAPTVMMASSATAVAPFQGLKSTASLPIARRSSRSLGNVSNGGRIRCMQVWPAYGNKKFETLSYLPPLSTDDLLKQVDYLLRNGWIPCLEFSKVGFVYRENSTSPCYYDGRYWTMWKLPMFGCNDATQVYKELQEAIKSYPDAFHRVIGFDNIKQTQCVSFIAYKPPGSD
ncbi:Ribulose bisphosphate carboxylase small chain, chloroplastic [Zea mays]|uniref:Ribulose bisphosphate carboxylase small subunit, chloroplastic n=1 Tax=Zea mays TaxID=4577 RepID=A0A3L6F452_MAIZE|nr:Ribulose bisphosphate carboxylase small chain, chloroplastic [Zea mays]